MCSVEELQTYAEEHLDWARTARTDRERDIFLKMAQAWLEVSVVRLEGASPLPGSPPASARWVYLAGAGSGRTRLLQRLPRQ